MTTQAQYVVVELRVDASNAQQGAAQYSAALDKAQQASDALTASAQKTQLAITNQSNALTQAKTANDNLAAANDNVTRSYGGFVQSAHTVGSGIVDVTGKVLDNIVHLKLLATAIYAFSPAVRSFVNANLPSVLKLIGVEAATA